MDLASHAVRVLGGETRSIDDQVEWRGNGHLLYGVADGDPSTGGEVDVWEVEVDGDAPARRLLRFASSPVAVTAAPPRERSVGEARPHLVVEQPVLDRVAGQ